MVSLSKVWPRTKFFSPNIRYFVAKLKFVAIYTLFGNILAKKWVSGSKTLFLGQEVHYYMGYIAHYTVQFANLQSCAKNEAFVAKIANRGKAANF